MIHFENVVKSYARSPRPALDDVDLRVDDGEFVYLVGVSGSGKSTVIRLLLCEERATQGRITVAGRDLSRIKRREVPRLRRDLGIVFQDFRLLPDKTVYDNVAYVLHVLGAKQELVRERVPETLDKVGLADLSRRLPHELSGGEQQRVAIARALVKAPRLLLADEPTGNLDPGTSVEIVQLLSAINADGTTVLMATHDDTIVNDVRRRVVQLDAGRIVRDEAGGAYLAPRPLGPQSSSGSSAPPKSPPKKAAGVRAAPKKAAGERSVPATVADKKPAVAKPAVARAGAARKGAARKGAAKQGEVNKAEAMVAAPSEGDGANDNANDNAVARDVRRQAESVSSTRRSFGAVAGVGTGAHRADPVADDGAEPQDWPPGPRSRRAADEAEAQGPTRAQDEQAAAGQVRR